MTDLSQHVIGGIEAAVLLTDGGGRVVFANPWAGRLFDRDLKGARLRDGAFEEDTALLVSVIGRYRAVDHGKSRRELIVGMDGDGPRYYWLCITPVERRRSGGGSVLMLQDITDALIGSEALRRVVSQVSHDIRSPLTSITGAAELLVSGRVGELPAAQRRLVGIVEQGAQKIADILARTKSDLAPGQVAGGAGGE